MSEGPLGLSDADFQGDPTPALLRHVGGWLAERADALIVDAPALIPLDLWQTAPLVVCRPAPRSAHRQAPFEQHAVVVVTETALNRTWVVPLYPRPEGPPPVDDEDDEDDGYGVKTARPDLRALVGLPWQPGRYRAQVLLRERISNAVGFRLGGSAEAYEDPEVARFIAARCAQMSPLEPEPPAGEPWPRYTPTDDGPAPPEQPGVVLNVPRVALLAEGSTCVLRGAFRLSPCLHERRPGEAEEGVPTAVMGLTLVSVDAEGGGLRTLRLRVPSGDPPDQETLTGHFALDLLATPLLDRVESTRFIYAFGAEVSAGPAAVTLIPADWLPLHHAALPSEVG
ncbi:MAG: hypothetical protein H6739_15755 [Alphaproteobacteria bacterium]|nr:hypothetical protein [Alphaproteobacteria bacterium]